MTNLLQVERPHGGFRCILADPPWAFETRSQGLRLPQRHEADDHYPMMSVEQLRVMPVRMLAARDSVLLMWVVDTHLESAFDLGRAWGFVYKSIGFIWDKGARMGMGYWTRKQGEVCLLFTRGHPPRLSGGVRQIIRAPRREHSRKPDEQYARIEALTPGPYLEMFARQPWAGWTSWGNDTGKFEGPSIASQKEQATPLVLA